MKANEAPEKIWIAVYGKDLSYEWHSDSEFEAKDHNDIEYTRTDALIKKACKWIRYNRWKYEDSKEGNEIIEKDFRKAMEE